MKIAAWTAGINNKEQYWQVGYYFPETRPNTDASKNERMTSSWTRNNFLKNVLHTLTFSSILTKHGINMAYAVYRCLELVN